MGKIIPVILSGGSGSRLWPKSRRSYPKQLHCLYGSHTMIQHTYRRVAHLGVEPIVVCNEDQRFMVAAQLSEVGLHSPDILLEPAARNTAAAIAVAALQAIKQSEAQPTIVVLAADHQIKDVSAFRRSLDMAIDCAKEGKLVAFGVAPLVPETGYGYIRCDKPGPSGASIREFVEKPNLELAKSYCESGEYFWNSGMFVFRADVFLEQLDVFEPELLEACRNSIAHAEYDLDFIRLNKESFCEAKNISVDYAVMEKTSRAWCVPLDAQWSDLGNWDSLWQASDKDANGNAVVGDVIVKDCKNSLFHSNEKLLVGIGLDNVVVVDTDDVTMVIDKRCAQNVKDIVDHLNTRERSEVVHHRQVYRPWGSYDSIDSGDRYQVKRIEVKPGASLSLQMHHHRAEHWIVVSGTAKVQRGDEVVLLGENQSFYVPLGEKHRLSNPGKVALQLIEVRSGVYLGEDDVVRYEDMFGRKCSVLE